MKGAQTVHKPRLLYIGRICQVSQKYQLFYPNVLYSFGGYQKNCIDQNIAGQTFLAQSCICISEYERKRGINIRSVLDFCTWPFLH